MRIHSNFKKAANISQCNLRRFQSILDYPRNREGNSRGGKDSYSKSMGKYKRKAGTLGRKRGRVREASAETNWKKQRKGDIA